MPCRTSGSIRPYSASASRSAACAAASSASNTDSSSARWPFLRSSARASAAPTAAAALSAWARCTCGSIRKVRPPAATRWPSRTYSAATEPETGAAR